MQRSVPCPERAEYAEDERPSVQISSEDGLGKMLKEMHRPQARIARPVGEEVYGDVLRVPPRFNSITRHRRLIFRVSAFFVFLALLFAVVRHDSYTAVAKLQIDNKSIQLGRQDAVFARSEVDVPLIQNQIELLRSNTIADQVISAFNLVDDPDFAARRNILSLSLPAAQTPEDRRRFALEAFERRLFVGRVGDSYTLEIRFTAGNPDQAASIANQIGSDYIKLLEETNANVARSASLWLQGRLKDMGPNASVITAATPPIRKDGPSSLAVLCAALFAGLTFGVTCAFAADVMDQTVRTPYQASAATGVECFGIVPSIKTRNLAFEAFLHPRSYLAHTIRRALAAIREQSDMKVVGVISILPGEGKTAVAANLAQLAGVSGSRVLLVDAALYSGKLSSLLAPEGKVGLSEVVQKKAAFADVLWGLSDTNVKFVPLGDPSWSGLHHPTTALGLQAVLSHAALFDLVVVDLPPATLVADVREAAAEFDGFLLVVEWGKTALDLIEAALAGNDPIRRKLLGVILNKVDIRMLRTYDHALSSLYDQKKYSTYLGNGGGSRLLWRNRQDNDKGVKQRS
jgi:succinoglycan biosynthesis transport protein ExoP